MLDVVLLDVVEGEEGGLPICRMTGEGQRQEGPKISDMKGAKAAVVGESGTSSMEESSDASCKGWRSRSRLRLRFVVVVSGAKSGKTVIPSKSTGLDAEIGAQLKWNWLFGVSLCRGGDGSGGGGLASDCVGEC